MEINFYIGDVVMSGVKKEFSKKALVRINSGNRETSEGIQKIAEYVFSAFNNFASKAYQYTYSLLDEDCCWIEINGNTTGLVFILGKKENKSNGDTLDFRDMVFDDCSQLVFNWLTECESKIEITPPSPKEILWDFLSKKPVVIRKKVKALLPLVDNYDISQAIRVTKGDPNSEEIIEALNYYDSLKQNEKQD